MKKGKHLGVPLRSHTLQQNPAASQRRPHVVSPSICKGLGADPVRVFCEAACPDLQRQYSLRTAGPLCLLSCDRAQPGAGSVPSLVLLVIIPVGCTLLTELIFPGAGHRSWSQLATLSRRVQVVQPQDSPSALLEYLGLLARLGSKARVVSHTGR